MGKLSSDIATVFIGGNVENVKTCLRVAQNELSILNHLFRRYDSQKKCPSALELERRTVLRRQVTEIELWLKPYRQNGGTNG